MIYVTGDTHGENVRFSQKFLPKEGNLTEDDCLIVCGDFGYVNDTNKANQFLDELEQMPFTIAFVDGNHENFPVIYSYPVIEWCGGRVHQIRNNMFHMMRGEVFEIENKTLFVFGGGYSIDRAARIEGHSWWSQEKPSDEEYQNGADNLKKYNFEVDYILTHTLPKEMILRYGKYPDIGEQELNGYLEWVMYETKFKHWYCGHWHDDFDLSDNFTVLWFENRELY